jgi:exodeoxyribonuclease VII large subunit
MRFPPASVLVAETYVQGPRATGAVIEALAALCREGVDVVVVSRGGGSFEDLLPFSDERLVRAIASCPVPVVTAVGHEQDTPLCDLVADVRASTPSVAGRLVVPDLAELLERLGRARSGLERGARRSLDRERQRLGRAHERLGRAPRLLLERGRARLEHTAGRLRALSPQSTLERGYAIVRANEQIVRSGQAVQSGERVEVELAEGGFGARVEETK